MMRSCLVDEAPLPVHATPEISNFCCWYGVKRRKSSLSVPFLSPRHPHAASPSLRAPPQPHCPQNALSSNLCLDRFLRCVEISSPDRETLATFRGGALVGAIRLERILTGLETTHTDRIAGWPDASNFVSRTEFRNPCRHDGAATGNTAQLTSLPGAT